MKKIIMFHGRDCLHCHVMMPIVDELSKREDIQIEKLEVWNNSKNAEKMRGFKDIIIPACEDGLGTPAFIHVKKNKAICGEVSYEELKKWINQE
ncbi:MAG: thioredoxin family protein [Nanoarchaeota archaeon]